MTAAKLWEPDGDDVWIRSDGAVVKTNDSERFVAYDRAGKELRGQSGRLRTWASSHGAMIALDQSVPVSVRDIPDDELSVDLPPSTQPQLETDRRITSPLSGEGELFRLQPEQHVGLTAHQWVQRLGRISSSLVAQIMGVSRFGGPYAAWATLKGTMPRLYESDREAATLGHLYERPALAMLARRHPTWEIDHNVGRTWLKDDWAAATPDALFRNQTSADDYEKGLIEIKHRARGGKKEGWGKPGTSDIPMDVLLQCLWQMWVVGRERCVVGLGAYLTLNEYTVFYQPAAVEQLAERLHNWYQRHIIEDHEPTVMDALPDTIRALKSIHGEVTGEVVEPDEHVLELAHRRHVFHERMTTAEKARDLCDARLRQIIGDAHEIEGVVRRSETRGRIDYKTAALRMAEDLYSETEWETDFERWRPKPSVRMDFIYKPEDHE